jgi:coenzyme F420-reducing hydrogenase alpha subunit
MSGEQVRELGEKLSELESQGKFREATKVRLEAARAFGLTPGGVARRLHEAGYTCRERGPRPTLTMVEVQAVATKLKEFDDNWQYDEAAALRKKVIRDYGISKSSLARSLKAVGYMSKRGQTLARTHALRRAYHTRRDNKKPLRILFNLACDAQELKLSLEPVIELLNQMVTTAKTKGENAA